MAKTKTRRVYVRAKRKRGKPKMKLPLLTIVGLIPGIANCMRAGKDKIHGHTGYFDNLATEAGRIYLGYDRRTIQAENNWQPMLMWGGTYPALIGAIASKFAGKLGVNRMFGRLPIKL